MSAQSRVDWWRFIGKACVWLLAVLAIHVALRALELFAPREATFQLYRLAVFMLAMTPVHWLVWIRR